MSKIAAPFIKGLSLCETFFKEAVKPILLQHFPHLSYSAGRLGSGSDVLGFDTERSRDHDWGPRCTLFLSEEDIGLREEIVSVLSSHLPKSICGYPTNYGRHEDGTLNLCPSTDGMVHHAVSVTTVEEFFVSYLGFYPAVDLSIFQWLHVPQQRLLIIKKGKVFHDDLNLLLPLKERLFWYPKDLWFFLMANAWRRLAQEEPFMGRCGEEGDEIGSRLVASRLLIEVMRISFLQERVYAPYFKWFGRAFSELECAKELSPLIIAVQQAANWKEREKHLCPIYECLVEKHNALQVTTVVEAKVSPFHSRPYLVIHGDRISDLLHEKIISPEVKSFERNIGSIDQFVDNTDVLSYPKTWSKVCALHNKD